MRLITTLTHLLPLLFTVLLLSSCTTPKSIYNESNPPPLFSGSPTIENINLLNNAIQETSNLFKISPKQLNFYNYHRSPYVFVTTLEKTVPATTTFIGSKPPFISLNNNTGFSTSNIVHETMHRLSPFLSRQTKDGKLQYWRPTKHPAISTYLVGTKQTKLFLKHYRALPTQQSRYVFFKDRFLKTDYFALNNDLKIASAHLVASILSDILLHTDSAHFLKGVSPTYIYSPEELLARAFSIYDIMLKTPLGSRFSGKGLLPNNIKTPLTKRQWASTFPNKPFNSFTAYTIQKEFNPNLNGYPRISPSTFNAITVWIDKLSFYLNNK